MCVCQSLRPLGVEAVCLCGCSKFPWQTWPKHHLDLVMCTKKKKKASSTTPLLFFLYKHVLLISWNTLRFFFAVLQCHHKTMFFVLCISYELTILSIFVPTEEVLICWLTHWGPVFLLSDWGFFHCCYISGCYCWPRCSPGKIFSPFPKRYNPHTHHTVSDPCLHDTWQIQCGVCVWACEHGMNVCVHVCVNV